MQLSRMSYWSRVLIFAAVGVSCVRSGYGQSSSSDEGVDDLVEDEVERFFNGIGTSDNLFLRSIPENPEANFLLMTSNNASLVESIFATLESIQNSSFDPSLKIKVIIHGYRPLFESMPKWVYKMADRIVAVDEANVVMVNWLDGVGTDYESARMNGKKTGAQVADLLLAILDAFPSYNSSNIHIIGFSLGSHAAGFAGKEMQRHNRMIGRITGLDPAGPGYGFVSSTERLDKSDAEFVDVIHTDAARGMSLGLGLATSIGHVDFFPNGGSDQAGCKKFGEISVATDVVRIVSCDHTRAVSYFYHSINISLRDSFRGFRCRNFKHFKRRECFSVGKRHKRELSMGYWRSPVKDEQTGSYFLLTNSKSPYCGRHYAMYLYWGDRIGGSWWDKPAGTIKSMTIWGRDGESREVSTLESENVGLSTKLIRCLFVTSCTDFVKRPKKLLINLDSTSLERLGRYTNWAPPKFVIEEVLLEDIRSGRSYHSTSITEIERDAEGNVLSPQFVISLRRARRVHD